MDMSTHMNTSYFDIRARLHLNKHGIINVHSLSVSVYNRHIAELIFDTVVKVLDIMSPSWKDTIIAISTDGERKMTSRVSRVATRFQNVAKPISIRICSDAHERDIVLLSVYCKLGNEEF